jgi:hypothetical protein
MLSPMRRSLLATLVALYCIDLTSAQSTEKIRLNQIQVLGSHNSYKLPMDEALLEALRKSKPEDALSLDYGHAPMPDQLDMGLRALELDVVSDPAGGLLAKPRGLQLVREAKAVPMPYDPQGKMLQPGLKVLHVPDFDFRSSVLTFKDALLELRQWSEAHPGHLPIVVTMNAKESDRPCEGCVATPRFDKTAFDAWDAEIRSILPPTKLLTPDNVRGSYPSLESAVLAHAWPTLNESRGKFLFVLDERGPKQKIYTDGHPSLKGRVMFVDAAPGNPEAAVLILNEPVELMSRIQWAVRAGYLVRTRADAETKEARKNDYSRWQAALASGAHIISTDYYRPEPRIGTGYVVRFPGAQKFLYNPLLLPTQRPLPALE